MDDLSKFAEIVKSSKNIVFFGGAGVSTESGIPDFRSAHGIFTESGRLSPEEVVSHGYFFTHTKEFYDFYRGKMVFPQAQPNAAHKYLARLEAAGKLSAVVTQNIDGLHQAAGSKKVFELHGSIHRNYCLKCGKFFPLSEITESSGVPHCSCGGVIKPDVVLYGESLDGDVISGAVDAIANADLLIIGGTSLVVYPAAGFIDYFRGRHLVVVNKSATSADGRAELVFADSIGKLFSRLSALTAI